MNVLVAKSAGYCFGVKRATNMAFDAAEKHVPISSLGPIIHSPQLVGKLEEKGVRVVRRVEDIENGAVIIRSHGVTASELDDLKERDLTIVDATCPFVKNAQEHARQLSRGGYRVIIVGEKEHPEVQGIVSFAESGEVGVIATPEEAEALPRHRRMGLVAQTTQSFENFRQIADICLAKTSELRIFNTICDATSVRQEEARQIAVKSDAMLVIGGFNSANTNRLAQICSQIQPRTYHVETAEQIEPAWFQGCATVGITAGASTPRWIIDAVVDTVTRFKD